MHLAARLFTWCCDKRETLQKCPPAQFFKRIENFFCCVDAFPGFAVFLVGDCCGAGIVYFERSSGFRIVVSCSANSLHLLSTIQTDRCGAFICLAILLTNLYANIVFVRATLFWCGTLHILNVLVVLEQFCCLSPIVYIY